MDPQEIEKGDPQEGASNASQQLTQAHHAEIQNIETSILIRVAGVPLMFVLLCLAVYIHYLRFTLFYVASLFVVPTCAVVVLFFFGKFTRDHIGTTILRKVYGFDHVSAVVIGQFCTPYLAVKQLTQEVDRRILQNEAPLDIEHADYPHQLYALRKQASEHFISQINARALKKLAQHRFILKQPELYTTGRLVHRSM